MNIVGEWYAFLSELTAFLGGPVRQAAERVQLPLVHAFLFGLLGATAPCQLTTNLSAIAFVSRAAGACRPWQEAVAYTVGKVLVYSLVGGGIIGLGLQIQGAAIPVVVVARKLLGPFMILIGATFVGWLQLPVSFGQRLAVAVQHRLATTGPWGAFVMGVVFSFAFCPTLFLLFFGLTIPLGLESRAGIMMPGAFAIGPAVPLLGYAALLRARDELLGAYVQRFSRHHRTVRKIAGAIFLLAGLHDTLTYWLL